MTSSRRSEANRKNARLSTGPKTKAGKSRSARNALRHGLSQPLFYDAPLTTSRNTLTDQIMSGHKDRQLRVLAERVAEAHLELVRVHRVRDQIITLALTAPEDLSPGLCEGTGVILDKTPLREQVKRLKQVQEFQRLTPPVLIPQPVRAFLGCLARLQAIGRYERSAQSRRRRAIAEFDDALQFGAAPLERV